MSGGGRGRAGDRNMNEKHRLEDREKLSQMTNIQHLTLLSPSSLSNTQGNQVRNQLRNWTDGEYWQERILFFFWKRSRMKESQTITEGGGGGREGEIGGRNNWHLGKQNFVLPIFLNLQKWTWTKQCDDMLWSKLKILLKRVMSYDQVLIK